jgi:hypothetical protein
MNKLYLIALLALVLAPSAFAAYQTPALDVALLRYEPIPAKPGDALDVWVQIDNTGDAAAENVQLRVDDGYPFTPLSATDELIQVGNIPPRNSYVTKVQVAVDRNAPDGEFTLNMRIILGNQETEAQLPIEIRSGAASLRVVSATTTPAELTPGSKGTLVVGVENIEDTLMRDLTVTLDLSNSVFAPLGSTNQQKIGRLEGGGEHTFTFTLIPEPDALSSVYRIPVNFTFSTNNGTRFVQQETIGIVVRATPELGVMLDETSLVEGDKQGTVTIRLVNKGLSEVKFTSVSVQPSEGYSVSGSDTVYVGNIDSDDFETAEFTLKPTADTFTVQTQVQYRDALNNEYTQTFNVPVSAAEPEAKGMPTWLIVLIVIAVVLGAIILWRRMRGKKR